MLTPGGQAPGDVHEQKTFKLFPIQLILIKEYRSKVTHLKFYLTKKQKVMKNNEKLPN